MMEHCHLQIIDINGKSIETQRHSYVVEHICKGGFRFLTREHFELEDRLEVQLHFPDDHTQRVLGRICYIDNIDEQRNAYGFSVIDGFYSNSHIKDVA